MKKRTSDPWMPAARYGRSLPVFTVNLLVRDVARAVPFYATVLGAELRLFGLDPDGVERRARAAGAVVVQPATTKGHGWREVMVEDTDGYLWAVGVPTAAE